MDEEAGPAVTAALVAADGIVTSELTLIECDRSILRKRADGVIDAGDAETLRDRLAAAIATWAVEPISSAVVTRARAPFVDDRIRALDAIHLASAAVLQASLDELTVLSLDERLRAGAAALGLRILPD